MSPRVAWLMAAVVTFAMLTVPPIAGRALSTDALQRQQSQSSSVGPVSKSVIASRQAHGADDGPRDPNAPFVPAALCEQDWILDLAVFWRWPGEAPELQQGSVGGEMNRTDNVHRIVVGERELRVQFDAQADTAQVANGPLVQLQGANVLMLDVGEGNVTVVGVARVEPRYRDDTDQDAMTALIERSSEVAAFVNRIR